MKAIHGPYPAMKAPQATGAPRISEARKASKTGKRRFTARILTVALLAVALGGAALPTAEAAVVWPAAQILPSFSTPAPVLDLMDVTTDYRYEAEGPLMRHNTGHLDGNGWLAQTGIDAANQHMVYGPYATDIPAGDNTAVFSISIDNNTANNQVVATIDVRDHTTGGILATRDLTRHDFTGTYAAQTFELPFVNPTGSHAVEFRVFWPGTSYVKVFDVGTNPKGKEDEALLFTTLKGIVNKTQPRIYSYDNAVRGEDGKTNWLNSLNLGYTEVADNWTLLTKYRSEISGIVIYDEALPDTLNLATTIAAQQGGIVAPPSLVAKLTSAPYQLPILDDLRGDFTTNIQVYQYMYDNLWPSVTHKLVVGLRPGIKGFLRDYATSVQAAVIWLNPQIPAEDALLRQFLADMPYGSGIYMGWWPDEGAGVARVSEYGLSTVASDFASNLTVFGGTDRNVAVKPTPSKPTLENKIYISFILSDGDNLQYLEHRFKKIWDSPNRGEVPLGWTVSPAMLDTMPGVLDYLYDTATPNDALISGPTGIGYTYPNLWGSQTFLDNYVTLSNDYMKRAGLKVLTVWNFINGATNDNVGNSFAAHAPSLLGLTAMNSGGEIKVYGNKLPSQGLNATYCYSEATLISEINGAIAGWDGQSPRFVTIQANPWDVTYQNFVNAKNHFSANSNLVFVRTDNYFQLMREHLQLPIDPENAVTVDGVMMK